ncbi:ABC transporter permease [Allokutzneria sp. NRRL B-24872]|uniref:ABC transporter permease n=1 Tax=Allokutzneria sp. NRRL B-24872 TaxID=1137961 RepID=UPI000A3B17A6|nr:ABC transporter permease [Allokutzneria sp. NRRL B-24872]
MFSLVLSGIRHRVAASIAVLLSALLGSALVLLSGALFQTGIELSAPPERLTGAPLVVTGAANYVMLDEDGQPTTDYRPYPERHRLDPSAAARVGAVRDVKAALPVFLITVGAGAVPTTAQNWTSAAVGPFTLSSGGAPSKAADIALSASLAARLNAQPGAQITLTTNGAPRAFTVTGVVGETDAPETVFLTDALAASLAGDGRPDAVAVLVKPGADIDAVSSAIESAVTDAVVLEGDGRGAAEHPGVSAARTPTIVMGAVFGGMVLVVLATVVSATIGLSVRQRAREMSLLRAAGATGKQTRRMIVSETLLVAGVGAVVGLAVGIPLAHMAFSIITGSGVVPPQLSMSIGVLPFAVAFTSTMLVVWLAARGASRAARRARAVDVLRDAEVHAHRLSPVRWVLGIVFLLGSIALGVITTAMSPGLLSATSGPAVLAGSIAAALLAPAVLRVGTAIAGPLLRRADPHLGGLAVHGTRARTAQLATVTSCVALVIGMGAGNLIAQELQLRAQAEASIATVRADVAVEVPSGTNAETVTKIASLDGVVAASAFVTSGGWIEHPYDSSHRDRPWPVRGVTADAAAEVLTNRVISGSLTRLTGKTVALPDTSAAALGVEVGESITFRFGDGTAERLLVVATVQDRVGYETMLLPAQLVAQHSTMRALTQILVRTNGDDVREAIAAAVPGASVAGPEAVISVLQQGIGVQALINSMLVLVTIAYAAIAVVNTLGVSVLSRRRELALLRLAGATRPQVRRALVLEVLIITGSGVAAGLAIAATAVLPTALVVETGIGAPASWLVLTGLLIAVLLLVAPVTAAAGRRAMAGRPAEAISTG